MTKTEALYKFFNSFGLTAYPANAVPSDVVFPWITYEPTLADTWEQANITVNLWYHTESEKAPNAKVEQISRAIGMSGVMLSCDDGLIWVKKGTPWCQSISDEADSSIKRRYLIVTLEFLTY